MDKHTLEAIHDSIATTLPILRELVQNSNPSPYTIQNIELTQYNIILSFLAFICSLIGAYYGWRGYRVSKRTSIGVERISPMTQRALILEYLRYVLISYLRLTVIYYAASKKKGPQYPKLEYVSTVSLPKWEDYYYNDRFQQFRDCVRSDNKKQTIFFKESTKKIREQSARNATIELKRMELELIHFDKLLNILSERLEKYKKVDLYTNKLLIDRLNRVILRNLTLLSFINPTKDAMTQCRYYWGRAAALDLLFKLSKEVSAINIDEIKFNEWHGIVETIANNPDLFIHKILNNEHFDIEEYIASSEWASAGIKSIKELNAVIIDIFTRLVCVSSIYYIAIDSQS